MFALLPESPWLRVERVALVRREIRESLSSSALDVLWSRAEVVVEGSAELSGDADRTTRANGGRFYATIMVTLDLERCSDFFREPVDAATALRVAELLLGFGGLRDKLLDLVRGELAELCGVAPRRLELAAFRPGRRVSRRSRAPARRARDPRQTTQRRHTGYTRPTPLPGADANADVHEVQLELGIHAEGARILIDGDAMVSLKSACGPAAADSGGEDNAVGDLERRRGEG